MIQVDISNVWGAISLRDLLGIEAETAAAYQTLLEGTGPGADFRGWMKLPVSEETEQLRSIRRAAERIRAESDVCVVVGSGSTCLGARGAIELLQGQNRNLGREKGDPQIFFAGDTLSTRYWNGLMSQLSGKDVSLILISQSETDPETAIASRHLRWMLERKYGTDEANRRVYAVTASQEDALGQLARENGWETFSVPANVADYFSVLTAAGLLPMAVAGIDILEVMQGAAEAKAEYDLGSFENPVWLYTALRNLLYRHGKSVELITSFEPDFRSLGLWWRQLMAMSGGKDGKGIFPATAQWPGELYSLGQLVQQGERNLFEIMVRFHGPEQEMSLISDVRDLDNLNYLEGKSLDYVEEQAFLGTIDAHVDGGVPVITMDCGALDSRKVGELFYFLELSGAISGYVLGVNPFDRSGAAVCREKISALLGKPGCAEV